MALHMFLAACFSVNWLQIDQIWVTCSSYVSTSSVEQQA